MANEIKVGFKHDNKNKRTLNRHRVDQIFQQQGRLPRVQADSHDTSPSIRFFGDWNIVRDTNEFPAVLDRVEGQYRLKVDPRTPVSKGIKYFLIPPVIGEIKPDEEVPREPGDRTVTQTTIQRRVVPPANTIQEATKATSSPEKRCSNKSKKGTQDTMAWLRGEACEGALPKPNPRAELNLSQHTELAKANKLIDFSLTRGFKKMTELKRYIEVN